MRRGRRSSAEAVAQALERLDARGRLARDAVGLGLRGEVGVVLGQLQQPPLGAALGGADRDVRAAPLAEHGAEPGAVLERRHDLRRDDRALPVELEQELLEHLGRLAARRRSPGRTPGGRRRRRRARGTPARWRRGPPARGRRRRTPRARRRAPTGARARGARRRAGRAGAPPSRTPAPWPRRPSRARCPSRPRRGGRAGSRSPASRRPGTPHACSGRRTGRASA